MASKLAPEAPEGCVLRRFLAQMPNLTTRGACGRAGGTSRGGPAGRSPPRGKPEMINLLFLLCLRA
eukprot:8988725-Alexandrium_andersonii.AAC.1